MSPTLKSPWQGPRLSLAAQLLAGLGSARLQAEGEHPEEQGWNRGGREQCSTPARLWLVGLAFS